MKRFISIAFLLCMLVSLQAQEIYTTGNIPKVHLQDKTRYVCNPAGILFRPGMRRNRPHALCLGTANRH